MQNITNASAKPKIRRQHAKVHSGCDTCRRRRVKCDETHPICERCRRARFACAGYPTRVRAWIVQTSTPESLYQHAHSDPALQTFLTPVPEIPARSLKSTNTRLVKAEPSSTPCPEAVVLPPQIRPPHESYEERRALHFWISVTGPTLSIFGDSHQLWTTLVPQRAEACQVLRHLLVATALLDEHLGLQVSTPKKRLPPLVYYHYQVALSGMINLESMTYDHLILASMIGWLFETMQSNHHAARSHLNTTSRLMGEISRSETSNTESTGDLVLQMRPSLILAEVYMRAMFAGDSKWKTAPRAIDLITLQGDLGFESLVDSRCRVSDRITRFAFTTATTTETLSVQKQYLAAWRNALSVYHCKGSETTLHKRLIDLLINIGIMLLPEVNMAVSKSTATSGLVSDALESVSMFMEEKSKFLQSDDRSIERTLLLILKFVLYHFHNEACQTTARALVATLRKRSISRDCAVWSLWKVELMDSDCAISKHNL